VEQGNISKPEPSNQASEALSEKYSAVVSALNAAASLAKDPAQTRADAAIVLLATPAVLKLIDFVR